jgi:hypothetical protein
MTFTINGAGPVSAVTEIEAQKSNGTGRRRATSSRHFPVRKVWSLHHGRARKALVRVVPDTDSLLYRIDWPDIGQSPAAHLARCIDAARQWAERSWVTEHRNLSVAQRLKSLGNFSWSASPMRPNEEGGL